MVVSNRVSRDNKALVAVTSARLNVVSTPFPNACKRQNRARAARMVRLRKRTSIAHGNWQTTLIRCAAAWMKEPRDGTVSSRGRGKASRGRKVNEANSRDSSRDSKVNEANRVRRGSNRGSKANEANSKDNNRGNSKDKKASRDNQDSSKVLKTVNSKVASRQAARKTAASRRVTETVVASIVQE